MTLVFVFVSSNHWLSGCRVCGLVNKLSFAHPKSLGLHLEERQQLAWGEAPHCRHWVFVILNHPAADGEITVEEDLVTGNEYMP